MPFGIRISSFGGILILFRTHLDLLNYNTNKLLAQWLKNRKEKPVFGIPFLQGTRNTGWSFLLSSYLDRICTVFFVSGCRIYFCLLCFTVFEEVYSYLWEQSVS